MGKNFKNRHATIANRSDALAFFTQSVPILTPTGVIKRQFYNNF